MTKLPAHVWRTLWAYHACVGVAAGLILHVMFVGGVATLFLAPLKFWEEPAQHVVARAESPQVLLERGMAAIAALPETPKRLWLGVPQGAHGVARFQYADLATGRWRAGWLTADGFVAEREQVATFLYHTHYLWHPALPELEYLAGLLALAFLLAVVTGVVIHVKDLWRQLTQFRPRAGRRVLWSDLHKVLGVLGLPFQLVWAYTGALLALGPVLITAVSGPVFGSAAEAGRVAWNEPVITTAPAMDGTPRTLDEALDIARGVLPGLAPVAFGIQDVGKPRCVIRVFGERDGAGPDRYASVLIHARSGAVLQVDAATTDLASHATRRWLAGIHYGYFGGLGVRVVLALLALAGSATILTGNWIWLARRHAGAGHVLARLTAGVGAGIFVAIAGAFVASRALPLDWAPRGNAEQLIFVGLLAACVAWALAARDAAALWWQQLALAGALFASTPLWAARLSAAGLFGAGPRIAAVAGVDAGLIVCGAGLLAVAWRVRHRIDVLPRRAPRAVFGVIALVGSAAVWPRGDGVLLGALAVTFWLSLIATLAIVLSGSARPPRSPS